MNDISNLSDTILAKSDRLNAEDLLAGPITVTVTNVYRKSADSPIAINYQGDNGRPFEPCKTMRKLLVAAWGEDGNAWIGRSMTLFNDQSVKWAGKEAGGVRISHLSHIEKRLILSLSETRGKKKQHTVNILQANYFPEETFNAHFESMKTAIESGKATVSQVITRCSKTGTLTDSQMQRLNALSAPVQMTGFNPANHVEQQEFVQQEQQPHVEEFQLAVKFGQQWSTEFNFTEEQLQQCEEF